MARPARRGTRPAVVKVGGAKVLNLPKGSWYARNPGRILDREELLARHHQFIRFLEPKEKFRIGDAGKADLKPAAIEKYFDASEGPIRSVIGTQTKKGFLAKMVQRSVMDNFHTIKPRIILESDMEAKGTIALLGHKRKRTKKKK